MNTKIDAFNFLEDRVRHKEGLGGGEFRILFHCYLLLLLLLFFRKLLIGFYLFSLSATNNSINTHTTIQHK